MCAFVSAQALAMRSFTPGMVCGRPEGVHVSEVSTAPITMRCRRDLKREKQLRNLEFARSHRKKVVRRFNRRAAMSEKMDEDNEYLSSVFGTISFGPSPKDTQMQKPQGQQQRQKQPVDA